MVVTKKLFNKLFHLIILSLLVMLNLSAFSQNDSLGFEDKIQIVVEITGRNIQNRFLLSPEISDSVKYYNTDENGVNKDEANWGMSYLEQIEPKLKNYYFCDLKITPWHFPNLPYNAGNLMKMKNINPRFCMVTKYSNKLTGFFDLNNKDTFDIIIGDNIFPENEKFLVMFDTSKALNNIHVVSGNAKISNNIFKSFFNCTSLSNEIFLNLRLATCCNDSLPLEIYSINRYENLINNNYGFVDTVDYQYFMIRNLVLPVSNGKQIIAFAKINKKCNFNEFDVFFFTNNDEITKDIDKSSIYEVRQRFLNSPMEIKDLSPKLIKLSKEESEGVMSKSNRGTRFPMGNIVFDSTDTSN